MRVQITKGIGDQKPFLIIPYAGDVFMGAREYDTLEAAQGDFDKMKLAFKDGPSKATYTGNYDKENESQVMYLTSLVLYQVTEDPQMKVIDSVEAGYGKKTDS